MLWICDAKLALLHVQRQLSYFLHRAHNTFIQNLRKKIGNKAQSQASSHTYGI